MNLATTNKTLTKISRDGFEYGSKQVYQIHQTIDLPAPLNGTIVLAEVLL